MLEGAGVKTVDQFDTIKGAKKMEKELYVINKEAKRLQDLNKKIWEREKDDTSYDEELVDLGLLHKLVYYYDREKEDQADSDEYIHTEYTAEAKNNTLRDWREGDLSEEELNNIEDSLHDWWLNVEGQTESSLIEENKLEIDSIEKLKEKVLTKLLKEEKSIPNSNALLYASQTVDDIDATNELYNFSSSYEECYKKLEKWTNRKEQ